MIHTICILPTQINEEEIFSSIDRMGRFLIADDGNVLEQISINPENNMMEDIVHKLDFINNQNCVGTTDIVYFTPTETIKMIYIRHEKGAKKNIIASILHPESSVVRARAILLKFDDSKKLINFQKEDLIKLLITRREHKGLHTKGNVVLKTVTMNNCWEIRGLSTNSLYKKIVSVNNYFLLVLSSNQDCDVFDDSEKYIFNLLDKNKKVIIDISETEFSLLYSKKDIESKQNPWDSEEYFSPYDFLISV